MADPEDREVRAIMFPFLTGLAGLIGGLIGLKPRPAGPGRWILAGSARRSSASFAGLQGAAAACFVMGAFLLAGTAAMEPRRSPLSGRVRLLYMGVLEDWWPPYRYLINDPFFDVCMVPANTNLYDSDDLRRWTRQYMPRTYQQLIEGYDLLTLFGAHPYLFPDKTHTWLRDAVTKDGLGSSIYGAGAGQFGDWIESTPLRDAFPVHVANPEVLHTPCLLRILKPQNPLMASLPEINQLVFYGFTRMSPKTGAEVLAELVPVAGSPSPSIAWWDVGAGRSLASTFVGSSRGDCPICEWKYVPDLVGNWHLFAAALPIPDDTVLLHEVRLEMNRYHSTKSSLVSTIEFIARFGADPRPVEEIILKADTSLKIAERMLLDLELQQALNMTEGLVKDLLEATALAIRLKNQALFWTHIAEWLALTATSLTTGFIIWTLMIRRSLYREIDTTKLSKASHLG